MSHDNTYASPLTTGAFVDSAFGATVQDMVPAGRGRRFVNFLIDGVIGRVFVVMVFVVVGFLFDLFT